MLGVLGSAAVQESLVFCMSEALYVESFGDLIFGRKQLRNMSSCKRCYKPPDSSWGLIKLGKGDLQ